jgi:hypothetical protein
METNKEKIKCRNVDRMVTSERALKRRPRNETLQTFRINVAFTAPQTEIIQEIAKYEKQKLAEFLGEILEINVEGHLDGSIPDLLHNIWDGRCRPKILQTRNVERQRDKVVAVRVRADVGKVRILNILADLTREYDLSFFRDSFGSGIEAHLEYESREEGHIPKPIAEKLHSEWARLIEQGKEN